MEADEFIQNPINRTFSHRMRLQGFIILSLLLLSCTDQGKQESEAEEVAAERYKEIAGREVDQYPLMGTCNELGSLIQQRTCFYNTLNQEIVSRLDSIALPMNISAKDSISSIIAVDNTGQMSYLGIKGATGDNLTAKLDSILKIRLARLPSVEPAIKRGVPVSTVYNLPIIIKPGDTLVP